MAAVTITTAPSLLPPHLTPWRRRSSSSSKWSQAAAVTDNHSKSNNESIDIKVCVNRSCSRQGSREILLALESLSPPRVSVSSCGCLGRCGAGPNAAVTGDDVTIVSHLGTPARAAQLLAQLLGAASFDPGANLEALAIKKQADVLLENGNFLEAEALFSKVIGMNPSGGLHLVYKSRCSARLAMGEFTGALADAEEAIRIAPRYPQAYIAQGDVFLAMAECNPAEKAYAMALDLDPSIRRSKSFQARVTKLREKLISANNSS